MTRRLSLAALGLALALWAAQACAQCPLCKTALTQSAEGQRIAADFNRAILVMVAAPYLVVGTIAGLVFRSRIREWLVAGRSSPTAS